MLRPPPRSTLTDTLLPYTTLFRSFIIFVGRMAFAVLVPSHGGDREVTVQQIFRLDIAAPYPLGLIACAAIIGLSPGKTGIEEQVMPHFLLNADADPCIGPRQRPGANSRDIAAESIEGNRDARPDRKNGRAPVGTPVTN